MISAPRPRLSRRAMLFGVAILIVAGGFGLFHGTAGRRSQEPAMSEHVYSASSPRPFRAARYEVTWAQWKACYDDGGCSFLPKPGVAGAAGRFPVTGVSARDVREYVTWLRQTAGKTYRLPTLAEWNEVAAGAIAAAAPPLFSDPRLAWAADYNRTAPVDSKVKESGAFGATKHGISDVDGNVWEWTATCAVAEFDSESSGFCPAFVVAGRHETSMSIFVRDPAVGGCAVGVPPANLGFRLVIG